MRGKRTEYHLLIWINGRAYNKVVIDQHYKEKHAESINDELILELLEKLNGETIPIEFEHGEFQYLTREVLRGDRPYRLILVIDIFESYLGVINAFRVDRR